MASLLRATSTVGASPLKPNSNATKEARGKLERLSKEHTPRGFVEEAPQRTKKSKEPGDKEKVPKGSQKKRKLVHITSSSRKFGTSVSHSSKDAPPSKLLDSAMKAIKVELVRRADGEEAREEAAKRASEKAEEETKKKKPTRTQGKSPSFLARRKEELAPALLKALLVEVQGATESFYKFWTDQW